jgi:hypothetical protein
MDKRFGTSNVGNMQGVGTLITFSNELPKYKFDLVGIQEVRWDNVGTKPGRKHISLWKGECES